MYEKVNGSLKNCEAGTKITNGIAGLESREAKILRMFPEGTRVVSTIGKGGPSEVFVGTYGDIQPFSYLDDYDVSHFRVIDDEEYLGPMELVKSQSTDDLRWAKSFINTAKKNNWTLEDINESLMLGWFANAIVTTEDSMR